MTKRVGGVVSRVSPVVATVGATGKVVNVVYVELLHAVNGPAAVPTYLVLTEDAVHKRGVLRLGERCEVSNVHKWSVVGTAAADTHRANRTWYVVTATSSWTHHGGEGGGGGGGDARSTAVDLRALADSQELTRRVLFPSTRPDGMGSAEECTVHGTVTSVNDLGWLEIKVHNVKNIAKSMCLFVSRCGGGMDGASAVQAGMNIQASFVLPVYLWGELMGFAASVRSTLTLVGDGNGSTSGATATVKKMAPAVRNRCHMYAAWRCYLDGKVRQAVAEGTMPRTAWANRVYRRIVDFLERALPGQRGIADVTDVTPYRAHYAEFADVMYAQLHFVRAGHDADWLCSHLVKVCTSNDLLNLKQTLLDADADAAQRDDGAEWPCRLYDLSSLAVCCTGVGIVSKMVERLKHVVAAVAAGGGGGGGVSAGAAGSGDNNAQAGHVPPQQTAFMGCVVERPVQSFTDGGSSAVCTVNDRSGKLVTVVIRNFYRDEPSAAATCDSAGAHVIVVRNPRILLEVSPLAGVQEGILVLVADAEHTCIIGADEEAEEEEDDDDDGVPHGGKRARPCDDAEGRGGQGVADPLAAARRAAQMVAGSPMTVPPMIVKPVNNGATPHVVLHVRQLCIATRCGPDSVFGKCLPALIGVVVYKGLQWAKPHMPRECVLVLRDVTYGETLRAYLPAAVARAAVVGLRVVLRNVAVKVSFKTKGITLSYAERQDTHIGVLGAEDNVQMASICALSKRKPLVSEPDMHPAYISPPPRTLVTHLFATKMENAAYWTLRGRVVYVKKAGVQMQCTSCYSKSEGTLSGMQCRKCHTRVLLRPRWYAIVAFDDGSGECLVYAEGGPALDLLTGASAQAASRLQEVREVAEAAAQRDGKVSYDGFKALKRKISREHVDAAAWEDNHWDDDGPDTARGIDEPSAEEELLESYVELYSASSPTFELQVKVIIERASGEATAGHGNGAGLKSSSSAKVGGGAADSAPQADSGGSGPEEAPSEKAQPEAAKATPLLSLGASSNFFVVRNIKVQEDNAVRPYSVSHTTVQTISSKRLAVEAVAAKMLGGNAKRLEAYKQLQYLAS